MNTITPENKLKIDSKLDELRKKRNGKALQLDVVVDTNKSINFQHALDEFRKLCEMHNLIPDEVNALGSQLQWLAMQVVTNQKLASFQHSLQDQLNNIFNPKGQNFEEKQKQKQEQESKEGIKRIKPSKE